MVKNFFDIVEDYKWTTTQGSYRAEAPRVFASAYSIDTNAITDAVQTYYTLVKGAFSDGTYGGPRGGKEYYDKLHKTSKDTPKENYIFPYFNNELRSFNNSWGDSYVGSTNGSDTGTNFLEDAKKLAETGTNLINQVNALASGKPGALFEPPKFYQYAQDEGTVNVSFVLINTDEGDDIADNYALVSKLINDNRFSRNDDNSFIVKPPKLWSVIIPGYRAIRWASCGVNVGMLGTRRWKDLNGKKILMPEGYNVELTFTPLYTEPSNFSSMYDQVEFPLTSE
jgi:hypothetical protein